VANPQEEIDTEDLRYPDYPVEAKFLEDPCRLSLEDLSTLVWLVLTDRLRFTEETGQSLAFAVMNQLDILRYGQDDHRIALKNIEEIMNGVEL